MRNNTTVLIGVFTLILLTAGGTVAKTPAYPPVTGFDLSRYLGTWYEVARLPSWFEKGLVGVTATYSLRDDGKVKVLNAGYKDSLSGKKKDAVGKAKFSGQSDVASLKVSFFGPFYGDYIVVALDKENYSWTMIASSPDLLWILSRTPQMDKTVFDSLIVGAKKLGFDTGKLILVPQATQ
jgi:apolipoprotein D and lipocalin family protein